MAFSAESHFSARIIDLAKKFPQLKVSYYTLNSNIRHLVNIFGRHGVVQRHLFLLSRCLSQSLELDTEMFCMLCILNCPHRLLDG